MPPGLRQYVRLSWDELSSVDRSFQVHQADIGPRHGLREVPEKRGSSNWDRKCLIKHDKNSIDTTKNCMFEDVWSIPNSQQKLLAIYHDAKKTGYLSLRFPRGFRESAVPLPCLSRDANAVQTCHKFDKNRLNWILELKLLHWYLL